MAAQTGLTQLGDALLRGTGDYANIALRRRQEEERRAQQLADLQNARLYSEGQREGDRRYSEGQFDKERGLLLEDESRRRGQKVGDETYQLLIKEGWLKPVDATNPAAIALAAENRQRYIDKERTTESSALENAQAELNSLAVDRTALASKDAALDSRIQTLQQELETAFDQSEMVAPTPKMIEVEAVRLANSAGVKLATKEPKRSEQLANYVADAERRLTQAAGMTAISAQNKLRAIQSQGQTLIREKTATTNQLQVVRAAIADLTRQFKLAPVRSKDGPSKTLSAPVDENDDIEGTAVLAAPGGPSDFIAQVKAAVAGNRPPPVEAPDLPAAPGAAPQTAALNPPTSILGMAQRLPSAGRMAMAPANILAAPGRAIDAAGRGISAGLQGLWNGDFSVPKTGLIEQAGTAIGDFIAGPEQGVYAEEMILKLQPNSPAAEDIRRRRAGRALPVLNPLPAPARADVFGRDFAPGRT